MGATRVTVSGRLGEVLVERPAVSVDVGVSLALTLATRPGPAGTLYVREGGSTRAIVERHLDRVVTVGRTGSC